MVCGDGIIILNEQCEYADGLPVEGCEQCRVVDGWECSQVGGKTVCTEPCGNGIKTANEACDDANIDNGDGCTSQCEVEAGFDCDFSQATTSCESICGDGLIVGSETCELVDG